MRECLAEGMIQAFMDGELSPDVAERAAAHAAGCAACARALTEAENELSVLAVAFEPELSLPVPSERLRERLDAALSQLQSHAVAPAPFASGTLKHWLSALVPSFNFAPRHAVGLASLIAVVAFAAISATLVFRHDGTQPSLIAVINGEQEFSPRLTLKTGSTLPTEPVRVAPAASGNFRRAGFARPKTGGGVRPPVEEIKPLSGEDSYLRTIASLSSVIESNGESALKPSLRADYERNLALVDQAINSTRRAARRNPKDTDAAEFLYSSYQSKIDLLSTVAEQGQLLAIAR